MVFRCDPLGKRGKIIPIKSPDKWSNHKSLWDNEHWKNIPRAWQMNEGWRLLSEGTAEAPMLA